MLRRSFLTAASGLLASLTPSWAKARSAQNSVVAPAGGFELDPLVPLQIDWPCMFGRIISPGVDAVAWFEGFGRIQSLATSAIQIELSNVWTTPDNAKKLFLTGAWTADGEWPLPYVLDFLCVQNAKRSTNTVPYWLVDHYSKKYGTGPLPEGSWPGALRLDGACKSVIRKIVSRESAADGNWIRLAGMVITCQFRQ